MKRTLVLLLCAALSLTVGSTSVFAGTNPKGKPFVAINEQIIEVKGAVSSLEEQVELLLAGGGGAGTVDEERIIALEGAIVSLQQQDVVLQSLIDNNLNSIQSIQAEIQLIQLDVDGLKSQVAANAGDVAALQTQIAQQESLIANLEAAILLAQQDIINLDASLAAQIQNHEDLVTYINTELTIIRQDMQTKQNIVDGKCLNGQAIQEILPSGAVVCGTPGMTTTYTYQVREANTNVNVFFISECPAGYNITGAGYANALNWTVHGVYPEIDVNIGKQYAVLNATNRGPKGTIICVATCSKIAQ